MWIFLMTYYNFGKWSLTFTSLASLRDKIFFIYVNYISRKAAKRAKEKIILNF